MADERDREVRVLTEERDNLALEVERLTAELTEARDHAAWLGTDYANTKGAADVFEATMKQAGAALSEINDDLTAAGIASPVGPASVRQVIAERDKASRERDSLSRRLAVRFEAQAKAEQERDFALAAIERVRNELCDKTNDLLDIRGILSPNGEARKVPMPIGDQVAPAVEWLVAEVERLNRNITRLCDELEEHDAAKATLQRVRALCDQPTGGRHDQRMGIPIWRLRGALDGAPAMDSAPAGTCRGQWSGRIGSAPRTWIVSSECVLEDGHEGDHQRRDGTRWRFGPGGTIQGYMNSGGALPALTAELP